MNRKIIPLALAGALFAAGSLQAGIVENLIQKYWSQEQRAPETIKILIVHDKPGVVLEVKGKYKLYDPHKDAFIATRFIGKRKFIQAMNDSIRWGEEFPGLHQLKIVPDDAATTTLVDGIEYKGNLYVYDIGGTISIVNEIPLDDYLRISLNSTYNTPLPEEAAAALAIAARGNAWYLATNPKSDFFSIEASKIGYKGYAAGETKHGMDLAIAETKDMILTKDSQPFPNEFGKAPSATSSLLSLDEIAARAQKGEHAAEILNKAFPGSKVSLITD